MEAGQSTGLSFKVTRLVHHKKYQFRVIAVNEIGDSDPLETTDGVTAKDPFGEICFFNVVKYFLQNMQCLTYISKKKKGSFNSSKNFYY